MLAVFTNEPVVPEVFDDLPKDPDHKELNKLFIEIGEAVGRQIHFFASEKEKV